MIEKTGEFTPIRKQQKSYVNNTKHEPSSFTIFKRRHLKTCEGGSTLFSRNNIKHELSSFTILRLSTLKPAKAVQPCFLEKPTYSLDLFASPVAHSVTGVYKMRNFDKTALALALELDNELAVALAVDKEAVF